MFHLRVQKIEHTCLFELSWGQGRRLSKTLKFPELLTTLYQQWQHAYINFYQTVNIPLNSEPETKDTWRGKAVASGSIAAPPTDWQGKLVEAETPLLYEFNRWLRNEELFEIHDTIAEASRAAVESGESGDSIDLFITCTPIELARLPWEAWEIRSESARAGKIRIARVPANIRNESASHKVKQKRRCPRILVILGNDTRLNFQEDWKALKQSLNRLAEIPDPIGLEPSKSIDEFKTKISQAITDEQGWDVLFFAGHGNETQMTGGELGIAPGVSIRVSEIAPQLAIARERGLQFALFNSCWGLSVAESLIDLGLSQVAVMREPIHNRVAQEFLIQFLKGLANHKDVHESLIAACQYLKTEKNLTYPSAHLVPSLFRYPGEKLFRIPNNQGHWLWQILQILFQRYQAAALAMLILASWQLPIQQWLLERRVLAQAIYRQATLRNQTNKPTPIVLVEIDEQSLEKEAQIRPIPRAYLARLIDRLSGAKVIGIDYLLYPPQNDDLKLVRSLENGAKRGTLFVFGASQDRNTGEWRRTPDTIANPNWSLSGSMATRGVHYAELVSAFDAIQPLSYVLASVYQDCIDSSNALNRAGCSLKSVQLHSLSSPLQSPRISPKFTTYLGYSLGQMWLHPIVDYSLPPNQIYTPISARNLLERARDNPLELSQKIILIVPNYATAGIDKEGEDNFPAPAAIQYWHNNPHQVLTGGKYHAYLSNHFLTQRLVIPIPDLWMIWLAAFLGAGTVLLYQNRRPKRQKGFIILLVCTAIYSLLSLELYMSSVAILLPIVLPVVTIWIYVLPPVWQQKK